MSLASSEVDMLCEIFVFRFLHFKWWEGGNLLASTGCLNLFQVEEEFDLPVWIERVPSQSNPSGFLSREIVTKFGEAEKVKVDPWEMWSLLIEVA